MKIVEIHFDNMDHSAVYVHPTNLTGLIKSHHKRPIVKISCKGNSILRKIRSKAIDGLDGKSILIDHISIIELKAQVGDLVSYEKPSLYDRLVTYYRKNPNEDLRGAWLYFTIGIGVGILGLVISMISLILTLNQSL